MVVWDWPTFFLFGCTLVVAFVCLRQYDCLKNERLTCLYLVMSLLPCFILFAFRNQSVGLDLVRYAVHIDQARYGSDYFFGKFNSGFVPSEILSLGIMYLSYYLGGIQPFIFVSSLLQFMMIGFFLNRLHNKGFNVALVFLIFFSVIQLRTCSMVRNGLSLAASFCAYTYLFENAKNKNFYWIFTLFALGFHNSAIINIPIYLICQPITGTRWGVYRKIFEKIIAVIAILAVGYFLSTGDMASVVSSISDGKYAKYEMSNSWGLGNFIIRLPLILLVSFYLKDLKKKYGYCVIICFYFLLLDLIVSQSRYIYNDFERLTQYTSFGEIIFVAFLYDFFKERVNFPMQFIYMAVVIAYFSFYMYKWAILDEYGLMPFMFMEW